MWGTNLAFGPERLCLLHRLCYRLAGVTSQLKRLAPGAAGCTTRTRSLQCARMSGGIENAPRLFLRLPDANIPTPGDLAWESAVAAVSDVLRRFTQILLSCLGDAILTAITEPPGCFRSMRCASVVHPDTLEYAIWLDELGEVEDHPEAGEAERVRVNIGSALCQQTSCNWRARIPNGGSYRG